MWAHSSNIPLLLVCTRCVVVGCAMLLCARQRSCDIVVGDAVKGMGRLKKWMEVTYMHVLDKQCRTCRFVGIGSVSNYT